MRARMPLAAEIEMLSIRFSGDAECSRGAEVKKIDKRLKIKTERPIRSISERCEIGRILAFHVK